jgi:hypothetical protein
MTVVRGPKVQGFPVSYATNDTLAILPPKGPAGWQSELTFIQTFTGYVLPSRLPTNTNT